MCGTIVQRRPSVEDVGPTLHKGVCWVVRSGYDMIWADIRQTDRYFIARKKVNPDLSVIEIRERHVHVYTTLLIC